MLYLMLCFKTPFAGRQFKNHTSHVVLLLSKIKPSYLLVGDA